jgi:hypothetical protein
VGKAKTEIFQLLKLPSQEVELPLQPLHLLLLLLPLLLHCHKSVE